MKVPAVIALSLCTRVCGLGEIYVVGATYVCLQRQVRHVCVSKHREFFDTNVQLKQHGCQGATDAMLAGAYARPQ